MVKAFWEDAIDPYTALHGVCGSIVGHAIRRTRLSKSSQIILLALIVIGFEIFEQWYFKESDNDMLEWGVNSATDILFGFAAGLTAIY